MCKTRNWKTALKPSSHYCRVYINVADVIEYVRRRSTLNMTNFKGKWQQKFLLSHLKEAPKQYIEFITEFLYLPYLVRDFDLKSLVVRHLG